MDMTARCVDVPARLVAVPARIMHGLVRYLDMGPRSLHFAMRSLGVLVKLPGVSEKQATSLGAHPIAVEQYAITPSCVTTLPASLGIVVTTCCLTIF